MLRALVRWSPLLLLAGALGCGGDGDAEDGICPGCTELAGGESSDFGGSLSACSGGGRQPLSAELATRYRIDEVRARMAGAIDASLRWTVNQLFERDPTSLPQFTAPPSGYQAATRVTGRVTLGEPAYREGVDTLTLAVKPDCPSWVELPASVSVATADGAIALVAEGALRVYDPADPVFGTYVPQLWATAAPETPSGQLRLHVDRGEAQRGGVIVELYLFPEGVRGSIAPVVNFDSALTAVWPDDGCGAKEVPLAPDSAHPWLDGKSFAQLEREWQRDIAGSAPASAQRLDGSAVAVKVELAPPEPALCLGGTDSRVVRFHTKSRLITSDGRVNALLTDGYLESDRYALFSPDGRGWGAGPRLDPDEFAASTGIDGIDALGSPWLDAYYSAEFVRTPSGVFASGALEVRGQPRCALPGGNCAIDPRESGSGLECMYWPPMMVPEICGRHLR